MPRKESNSLYKVLNISIIICRMSTKYLFCKYNTCALLNDPDFISAAGILMQAIETTNRFAKQKQDLCQKSRVENQ